ncbi:hypothetical protein ACTVCO_01190 [Sanguibacter sp. A247]|uniref:hypothetical protein n=1 Tax=unclassified Sanguibacter TaxID=2645534 RepID=UPI003FD7BB3B
MKTTTRTTLVAVAGIAMVLAGCSGGTPGATSPSGVTVAPVTPAPAGADATSPATATAPAAERPGARQLPAECASLDLAPGAHLGGKGLGACVSRALVSYGSGRMEMTGEQLAGTVAFTYDPDYAFRVEGEGATGAIRMSYVDGEIWLDDGSGPVRGDADSDDMGTRLAGFAGEAYRALSDPALTADLVAASDGWTVAADRESRTLPDGSTVEAFRIVSDKPFTWNEMPVTEYVLWYGDDWVPVGAQGTVAVFGTSATSVQTFYDLGADITIEPLG